MAVLTTNEIQRKLGSIKGWSFSNNQLEKEFILKDFISAIKLINEIAVPSEEMNHHPDILIYGWNKVRVTISTHSEGGVTENDFILASKIDGLI